LSPNLPCVSVTGRNYKANLNAGTKSGGRTLIAMTAVGNIAKDIRSKDNWLVNAEEEYHEGK
jgi:hypothetical protein